MANKDNKVDEVNERSEMSKDTPKIYSFDTYKKGKILYGTMAKYKKSIKDLDKIHEEIKAILDRTERGIGSNDGDKNK